MEGDAAYFGRRAREEYAAAMRATHPNVRQTHVELAKRYSILAHAIEGHEIAWGIGSSDDPLSGRNLRSAGDRR
jgi:hypothetical protein